MWDLERNFDGDVGCIFGISQKDLIKRFGELRLLKGGAGSGKVECNIQGAIAVGIFEEWMTGDS